ncbi:MAG TPA: hypothetical protein VIJ35_25845, partial [Bradyrhizobium sp.]
RNAKVPASLARPERNSWRWACLENRTSCDPALPIRLGALSREIKQPKKTSVRDLAAQFTRVLP